jgi:hypothetical protein
VRLENNKTWNLFDEYHLCQDLISMADQADIDEKLYTAVMNVATSNPDIKIPQKG